MSIEGKIANAYHVQPSCGKCEKELVGAEVIVVGNKLMHSNMAWTCSSYLGTDHYIYETKNGRGVCYCSEWCAKKHNHRFK